MRRGMGLIVGAVAACGLQMFTSQPSQAQGVEKSLLGIRILQTYREVLKLYGAPTRVYRMGEKILVEEAVNAEGDMTGGIRSLESGGTGGGGGGMPGSGGGPSSGGGPGTSGENAGGGPGRRGGPGNKGGGMPGSGGGPGSGGNGISSGGGDDSSTTFGEAGGYVWAYYYPVTEKLYLFFFSAQGRLLITFERGRFGGGGTSNGINLGSTLASVYNLYGWPDSVEEQGPGIVLNYTQKHHLVIAVLKGKVVGLAVSLFEQTRFRMLAINDQGNGGGGGGGSSPGGGGRSGGGGGSAASAK